MVWRTQCGAQIGILCIPFQLDNIYWWPWTLCFTTTLSEMADVECGLQTWKIQVWIPAIVSWSISQKYHKCEFPSRQWGGNLSLADWLDGAQWLGPSRHLKMYVVYFVFFLLSQWTYLLSTNNTANPFVIWLWVHVQRFDEKHPRKHCAL